MAPHALSFLDALLLDITAALIAHFIYNRWESPPYHGLSTTLLLLAFPSIPAWFWIPHFSSPILAIFLAYALFHTSLVTSVLLYRLSPFHPLARFPGPFAAKLTKLWSMKLTAGGKQHLEYKKLHEKYGPYVRVGPNELSCLDANAIPSVLGPDGMPKGPMWDGRRTPGNVPGLIALRDAHEHTRRRRPWNRAFSTQAVKGYEPIVRKRALQLAECLERTAREGGRADMAVWMSYFATDFMGDMAFGGGFELMNEGDKDGIWHLMEAGLKSLAILHHIPWVMPILWKSPKVIANIVKFRNFAVEKATERKEKGATARDLFHYLIDEDGLEPTPPSFNQIISDAALAIVAGSDTTANVLSNIFFYLLSHPWEYARLREEVDSVFPPGEGEPFDSAKLAEMGYLNAVINEGLRLQPPVPSGSQRAPAKGSGGKSVCAHYIPEGTAIFFPMYALHRDPRYFSPLPDLFWPDRWLPADQRQAPSIEAYAVAGLSNSSRDGAPSMEPDLAHVTTDVVAFIPFSYGPGNCAGKNLALLEMRMVLALLVQRLEMRFEEGYELREWEAEKEDWFVMKNGRLPVVLKSRT